MEEATSDQTDRSAVPGGAGAASIELRGLVKHFGHVRANDGIDVEFRSSEIHALLGENGAGKSTLIKILSGIYRQDAGTILCNGKPVRLDSPLRAREHGIAVVHQHSTLVPRLTVFENVVLLESGIGRFDRSLAERLVASGRRLGFDVDPNTAVERLTPGNRQRVDIARALMTDARFVIFDEPTAVLAPAEREGFFGLLARLAAEDVGVIFITHHLKEALRHSHRLTILRRGRVVARAEDPAELGEAELVRVMVGDVGFRPREPVATVGDTVLRVRGLSGTFPGGRTLHDIDFAVRAGEVLGIAGVEGNGQSELAAALTGAWTPDTGTVEVKARRLRSYPRRERARLIADVPDDYLLATADDLPVWVNIGLTEMAWHKSPTPAAKRRLRQTAMQLVSTFSIRTPTVDARVGQLSGGNRRRVVLARELSKQPTVLVASFATNGLDVRSIEQVKQWTRELARQGAAVVYIASDLEELLDVSDRVAVISRGRITGELAAAGADLQEIGQLMLVAAEDAAR